MKVRLLTVLALLGAVQTAPAQTAADTASVILEVARNLQKDGRPDAARELLRYLKDRYGMTAAARTADSLMRSMPTSGPIGNGRTGFVTFNTLYGAFLGVAIPAAFDAQGEGEYGLGLLLGAPVGFFASRAFARAHFRSAGQAGIASFATAWGTWHGLGVQQTFNLGEPEECINSSCFSAHSDTAPWAAMVAGGVVGLGIGWAIAASKEIRPGTSTMISHTAVWGSWFGLSVGSAAGAEDDALWATMLVAGDAALLMAIPAARAWQPTSSRVRLITAAGLAGTAAGFGVDLLASVDDDRLAFAIPAATSALGLIIGALATKNRADLDIGDGSSGLGGALVEWNRGEAPKLKFALPEPAAFEKVGPTGRSRMAPGAKLKFFDGRF